MIVSKVRMLRPSQFQLNSTSTSDAEKTSRLKPSLLNVTSPLAAASPQSSSSNNSPGNCISNNSNSLQTQSPALAPKDSDGESSNSNSGGPLFTNPFMRGYSRDEESPSKLEKDAEIKETTQVKKDENLDPLAKLGSSSGTSSGGGGGGALPKSNLFNVKAATLSSSGSGFVFGQNIGERVTGQSSNIFGTAAKSVDGEEAKKVATEQESSCNGAGSSGLFFSNVATNSSSAEKIESKEVDGKSLLEATREYEESKSGLN